MGPRSPRLLPFLVCVALASACASPSASPIIAAAPAPPAQASLALPVGEPEEPPGLGPLVPLTSPAPSALAPVRWFVERFQRGLLGFASYDDQGRCPSAGVLPPSCRAVFFAPFRGEMGASWARLPRPGTTGPWKVTPVESRWERAFPGRDVVLALSHDGRSIGAINEGGELTFPVPDSAGIERILDIVQTSRGLALLGQTSTRLRGFEVEVLAVYPLDFVDGKARLDRPVVLPFSRAASLAEGRFLLGAGLRSMLTHAASPGVTAGGELAPSWTLAWLEAILPPGKRRAAQAGSPSPEDQLPLSDPAIEKRVHVLSVDRSGAILGDRTRAVPARAEAPPPLPDDPTPTGPVAAEPPLPREQRDGQLAPPTVIGRPAQRARQMRFDPATGEGEATFDEAGSRLVVRFDGRGKILGQASPEGPGRGGAGDAKPRAPAGLPGAPPDCPMGVETAPGRGVLLCDEPHEGRLPGRLGLRHYRYRLP